MTEPTWPELPSDWSGDEPTRLKYRELRLAAEIDVAKGQVESSLKPPPSPADDQAEIKLHETLGTLVVASIERARDGAKFVETAAAALATIYTGILAFSFAAASTHLPVRGIYAAIFLGLAIVGSSFYLAFIQEIDAIGRVTYTASRPENLWRRTEYLGTWTQAVVRTRAWALRAAVVALAWGVFFMPIAFLPDHVGLPAGSVSTASQAPGAAPAPTVTASPDASWPPPPAGIADPEVAAVLYKAQLDEYAKSKSAAATSAPATGLSTDLIAVALLGIAFITMIGAAFSGRRSG